VGCKPFVAMAPKDNATHKIFSLNPFGPGKGNLALVAFRSASTCPLTLVTSSSEVLRMDAHGDGTPPNQECS